MADWYYTLGGEQRGPVSGADLKALATRGEIGPDDLVWNESMAEWAPARRVKGLGLAPSPAPAAAAPLPEPSSAAEAQAAPVPQALPPMTEYAAPLAAQAPLSYAGPSGEAVTHRTLEILRQTKPWARLVSIIIFIGAGFMIFGSLAFLVIGAATGGARAAGVGAGLVAVYSLMALLYIFPALFLFRYASRIGKLLQTQRSSDLESALEAQKSFWKFIGILFLVVICIYLVIIAVAAIMAAAGMLH